MQYSFVIVLCLGALLQCNARPQQPNLDSLSSNVTTTPAPSDVSSAASVVETATEVNGTAAGEQVVFDEGEPVVGGTNDEDADVPTTSMPEQETQNDEVTTTPPCTGDNCNSPVVAQDDSDVIEDDAPAAPSEDDEVELTTETSSSTESS